jgi:hypothetical protein
VGQLSPGELTALIMNMPTFQEVMKPHCDRLDGLKGGRGPRRAYTAWELESVLLFGELAGAGGDIRRSRDLLAADRHVNARRLLGFDSPRACPRDGVLGLMRGVPSEATLSRHRRRFGQEARTAAWEQVRKAMLPELLELTAGDGPLLIMTDGTKIETHYTAPIVDRDGQIVNADRVTAPDAGYVGQAAPASKRGHGWLATTSVTQDGGVLAWGTGALHQSELEAAIENLREIGEIVRPHLSERVPHIAVGDGIYSASRYRRAAQEAGFIVSASAAKSGVDDPDSNAEKQNRRRIQIHRHPNWKANGHRELICDCGQGKTRKILDYERNGGEPTSSSSRKGNLETWLGDNNRATLVNGASNFPDSY